MMRWEPYCSSIASGSVDVVVRARRYRTAGPMGFAPASGQSPKVQRTSEVATDGLQSGAR
jgi:hypothetical protein